MPSAKLVQHQTGNSPGNPTLVLYSILLIYNLGVAPLVETGPRLETCSDAYRDHTARALGVSNYVGGVSVAIANVGISVRLRKFAQRSEIDFAMFVCLIKKIINLYLWPQMEVKEH